MTFYFGLEISYILRCPPEHFLIFLGERQIDPKHDNFSSLQIDCVVLTTSIGMCSISEECYKELRPECSDTEPGTTGVECLSGQKPTGPFQRKIRTSERQSEQMALRSEGRMKIKSLCEGPRRVEGDLRRSVQPEIWEDAHNLRQSGPHKIYGRDATAAKIPDKFGVV